MLENHESAAGVGEGAARGIDDANRCIAMTIASFQQITQRRELLLSGDTIHIMKVQSLMRKQMFDRHLIRPFRMRSVQRAKTECRGSLSKQRIHATRNWNVRAPQILHCKASSDGLAQ